MNSKYFSVEVKPTIAASKQHAGGFTAGNVMFDWVAVQVPRGTACLRSATLLVRPKGDASPTANQSDLNVVFAKSSDTSLGTVGSSLDHRPNNDFLGVIQFPGGSYPSSAYQSTAVATMPAADDSGSGSAPIVLTPANNSDSHAGFDTIYVGGVAGGSFDFRSINVINDGDINSTAVTAVVMTGSGMDVREHFAVGDVLHAQDDILLGTVASIDAATTGPINLTAATSGAGDATTVANGDTIYNIHPIRLILGFEY
jgi:hypothetical protein